MLVIDADHQGSVGDLLLTAAGIVEVDSRTERLLSEAATLETLERARIPLNRENPQFLSRTDLVPAFYSLSREENRHMVGWVMSGGTDVRYRFSNVLLQPGIIKRKPDDPGYDVILIDAPPRLTTATINALCASTHLVVPTALTQVSARTVRTFLQMAWELKLELNGRLTLAGVVPTLTSPTGNITALERQMIETTVTDALGKWPEDPYIFQRVIPRRSAIANAAGNTFAYWEQNDAALSTHEIINQFGMELVQRIQLRDRPPVA